MYKAKRPEKSRKQGKKPGKKQEQGKKTDI